MFQKVLARPRDVLANLVGELERGAELLFAPQELVEVEAHGVAVDIGVEVEDVALDGDRIVFVERRTHADVGHALEGARETLEARRRDVPAAAGKELVRGIDIHLREAELAAEAAAGGDAAVDEVTAAEGEIDGGHGAFGDRGAA